MGGSRVFPEPGERLTTPARLAVFASGGGTNLQALLDHFNARESAIARVALVISNRDGVHALERAERAGVSWRVINPDLAGADAAEAEMLNALVTSGIDLVALAGYLKRVPPRVVARYSGRIVNIHPALLPSFGGAGMYGMRVHRAVLDSGARVSGVSIHLVDDRYDEGHVLAQWPVPVHPGDTPESLAARVLEVEHLIYPVAIEALLPGGPPAEREPPESFELVDTARPRRASIRRLNANVTGRDHPEG